MGIPSDDAITGIWTVDVLIPSFVGTGLVQPDVQVTPGGLFCAFTGNAASSSSGAGDNDVDGGNNTYFFCSGSYRIYQPCNYLSPLVFQ
ncbi:MAG: hypothetical protein IPP34_09690 [Bacteroidetes bacterium]|nr:hypothetical protein [Bacteroidota bacterium]